MKNILIDISGKVEKTIVDALYTFNSIAESLNIPFFIIGALARDFILDHLHDVKAPRRTYDIDLGVKVASWNRYNQLITTLINSGKFTKQSNKQRLKFNDTIIDLIPFGGIAGKNCRVSWPPEQEIIMNLLGFDEVYRTAANIRLIKNPVLKLKVPSLPGLAILKLISWKDNYPERKKDAEDLLFIMENYQHAIQDILYDKEIQLFESVNFDNKKAGIKLLGRYMKKISCKNTLDYISNIITEETEETSRFHLAMQMMNPSYNFENILELLIKLREGFFEHYD